MVAEVAEEAAQAMVLIHPQIRLIPRNKGKPEPLSLTINSRHWKRVLKGKNT